MTKSELQLLIHFVRNGIKKDMTTESRKPEDETNVEKMKNLTIENDLLKRIEHELRCFNER